MDVCSRARGLSLCAVVLVAIALFAHPALADESHDAHSEAHLYNIIGAKATGLADNLGEAGGGATLFYERSLLQGWLEVELGGSVLAVGEHTIVPVDLVFKLPFGCNHVLFEHYVGAGAALDLVFAEHDTEVYPGLVAVAGAYLWLTETFGLDLELSYSVVFETHVVHELLPALGVVAHF